MATDGARSSVHEADQLTRHVTAVVRDGFAAVGAPELSALISPDELASLQQAWQDLPADNEMRTGESYRYRRYGRVLVDLCGPEPRYEPLPHAPFRQDSIPLWRGRRRMFAPILPSVLQHPALRTLVEFDARLGSAAAGVLRWEIGLHLVRIVARDNALGQPTPEGRHRDGHLFVGMHLLWRHNCAGGRSVVHAEAGDPVTLTLTDPLDSLFVADHRVTHEVTPIVATAPGTEGRRDMLLVDLNPAVDDALTADRGPVGDGATETDPR